MNPMLGIAAAGWASSIPEITAMQARAIFEAACDCQKEGIDVQPEIMIPLVGFVEELRRQQAMIVARPPSSLRGERQSRSSTWSAR